MGLDTRITNLITTNAHRPQRWILIDVEVERPWLGTSRQQRRCRR
jgi:hypothetical protein